MHTRIVPQKYVVNQDALVTLASLVGFLIAHAVLYSIGGIVKAGVYICMIIACLAVMHHFIKRDMYWYAFIFAIIGTISVFVSLESIGSLIYTSAYHW